MTAATCPRCHAPLRSAESPQGLCPKCLLAVAMGESAVVRTATGEPAPDPPAPEELAPHFEGLRIGDVVGRGGMGVVYRAHQEGLDRPVALMQLNQAVTMEWAAENAVPGDFPTVKNSSKLMEAVMADMKNEARSGSRFQISRGCHLEERRTGERRRSRSFNAGQ